MSISFFVAGLPAPQGSKTRMPNGALVDGTSATGRANLAAWRDAVRAECRRWLEANPQAPLAEPVGLTIEFRFPVVTSSPYRYWHVSAPDVDKLARSCLDSLKQGGLLADDRYVCSLTVSKTYCTGGLPAGARVIVESLAHVEAMAREGLKSAAKKQRARERQAAKAAS